MAYPAAQNTADCYHWRLGKISSTIVIYLNPGNAFISNCLLQNNSNLWQVLSILILAAACSAASVVDLLLHSDGSFCPLKVCRRYQVSTAMAFLSWFLSMASSLFNLWLLPSL